MATPRKSGSPRKKSSAPNAAAKQSAKAAKRRNASRADATAERQRGIQDRIEAKDSRKKGGHKDRPKPPVQAGTRRQPERMPAQHLAKPGREEDLSLAPRYLAPDYAGSGKLEGMKAIVTGADSGIGRAVAVLFAREGADVAILDRKSVV